MIVKCPDCNQELTDTTVTCPMCGCRVIEKREQEMKTKFPVNFLKIKKFVLSGKFSPFHLFFCWKGGIDRAQFFFALIELFLLFYLCHVIRRELLISIPVKHYYTAVGIFLLLLDLNVLWKRLYSVAWKRILVFPFLLLLLVMVYTRIELLFEISLLIFLLLHAVLFATPEQPEK